MKNIFSVDVEEWYHSNLNFDHKVSKKSRVEHEVDILLQVLDKTKSHATFFVLGEVAKDHKSMVRRISSLGHEIASHSYNHDLIYEMTKEKFIKQAKKSKDLLENIIGQQIFGFRAPSWSVGLKKTPWFWKALYDTGYKYSSSMFPFKTYLYGDAKAPRFSFGKDKLIEIPPSTFSIWKLRFPFSGGFYLRASPLIMINLLSGYINMIEKKEVVYYIHPREIDNNQPKMRLSRKESLIHNLGIRNTEKKLIKIIAKNKCISFKEYLNIKTLNN